MLGLATGSSPSPVYAELVRRFEAGEVSFAAASAFTLDEYLGLPPGHPEGYRQVIEREFASLVDLPADHLHTPDGQTHDVPAACAAYEKAIAAAGGVDLQLLGIGSDGHLAFNEPGSSLASRTRVKTLTPRTRADNARFFDSLDQVPHHVLTQGLGTILEARHLVMLATGNGRPRRSTPPSRDPSRPGVPRRRSSCTRTSPWCSTRRPLRATRVARVLRPGLGRQAGLARHLTHRQDDPMPSVTDPSLGRALDRLTSRTDQPGPDDVFGAFVDWTAEQGITLYPAQEEALIEVVSGANVILGTPTGSGKSLVALGAHVSALAAGGRTFYTAPIKALVSEKFFALCDVLGPERVGMLTGDASVNAEARLVCCTAEVLANIALREEASPTSPRSSWTSSTSTPSRSGAGRGRSRCWSLARAQFLLMSATLGDTARFEEDLVRRTGRPTVTIASGERPVPLFYSWAMTPLHETVAELLDTHRAPVYVVHFTQAAALERAQSLLSVPVASREQRDQIAAHIAGFRFSPGFGRTLNRLVRHGIGVHTQGCCRSTGASSSSSRNVACCRWSVARTPSGSASTCRSGRCSSPGSPSSTAHDSGR